MHEGVDRARVKGNRISEARRSQLDALRCVAVVPVMVAHVWQPDQLPWIFGQLDPAHLGVQLFFVLSGFLITCILLECRELSERSGTAPWHYMQRFYARRFLRIFPLYYLTLMGLLVLDFERTRELSPWLFSYTSNLYISFEGEWIGKLGHLWTLAVEEQFYLFWPWLILFLPRRWLIPSLLALICLAPISRLAVVAINPNDLQPSLLTGGTFTLASWDSLGAGALLAVLSRCSPGAQETVRRWLATILSLALAGVLVGWLADFYLWPWRVWFALGDVVTAIIFGWLIVSASVGFGGRTGRVLNWRPLVYIGSISYGIYLLHPFVWAIVFRLPTWVGLDPWAPGPRAFLLTMLGTVAIAAVSWRFFEAPINGLKLHFSYSGSRHEQVAGGGASPEATVVPNASQLVPPAECSGRAVR